MIVVELVNFKNDVLKLGKLELLIFQILVCFVLLFAI